MELEFRRINIRLHRADRVRQLIVLFRNIPKVCTEPVISQPQVQHLIRRQVHVQRHRSSIAADRDIAVDLR